MSNKRASEWISELQLEPMLDGTVCMGHYRQSYKSQDSVTTAAANNKERPSASSIHFLHQRGQRAIFHKQLTSNEVMVHVAGNGMDVYLLGGPDGKLEKVTLGRGEGQQIQVNVPADTYMAFEVCEQGDEDFCLTTCIAAPAYDFMEDIAGKRKELLDSYPQHQQLIKKFTREEE